MQQQISWIGVWGNDISQWNKGIQQPLKGFCKHYVS